METDARPASGPVAPPPDDGTDPAFRALFATEFEPMRRLAFLLGADDPENIAQEAFVRLHERWSRLRDKDKALPYLRATVANLSRSRVRHLRVVRDAPTRPAADAVSAEEAALATKGPLWTALSLLGSRQRQVVVLRYWLDLTVPEIAATLRIADGTVKATLSRALDRLRDALPAEEESP